jgi:hypothetical protein
MTLWLSISLFWWLLLCESYLVIHRRGITPRISRLFSSLSIPDLRRRGFACGKPDSGLWGTFAVDRSAASICRPQRATAARSSISERRVAARGPIRCFGSAPLVSASKSLVLAETAPHCICSPSASALININLG